MKSLICFVTVVAAVSAGVRRPLGLSQDGTYWPEKAQGGKRLLGLSQDGTYWPEKARGGKRLLGLSQDGTYWPEKAQGGKRLLGLSQDGTYWPEKDQAANPLGLREDGTYGSEIVDTDDDDVEQLSAVIEDNSNGHSGWGLSSMPGDRHAESEDGAARLRLRHSRQEAADDVEAEGHPSGRRHQRRQEGLNGNHGYGMSYNPIADALRRAGFRS